MSNLKLSDNRIVNTFTELKNSGKKALIAFITGGDPDIETTEKLILQLEKSGVDIIEIGIPFSDPMAEGAVIQKASERALDAGCTVDKLFEMVERLRKHTNMPLLFMTYANPVFGYGKERFTRRCREVGIDGLIIPDVPFEERNEFSETCDNNGLCLISLIAPTSGGRVREIAAAANGFLYCVSSLGVTGTRREIKSEINELIREVKQHSNIPCAVGFGISTPEQAKAMLEIADGVIIGSAIVEIIAEHGADSPEYVGEFISELLHRLAGRTKG